MSNAPVRAERVLEPGGGKATVRVVLAACALLALPAPAQAQCECEGGIVVIELRAGLPYGGGTISVEARAARRDQLDSNPYGVDTESFDGSLFTSSSFSGAVAITRIASNGTEAVVTMEVDASRIGKHKLDSNAVFRVTFNGTTSAEVEIHTSCSLPIGPPFEFGGFRLLGFTDFAGSNVCQPSASDLECGDGTVESNEECDDGGTTGGDGCSALCEIEPIEEGCGDGVLQPELGEGCDDGGTANGDGCDSACHVEAGYGCGGPISCESAWQLGDAGAASCFFEGGLCLGCGPENEGLGLCTNTCVPPTGPTCSDLQRTIFAGGPLTQGCGRFDEGSPCQPICGDGLVVGTEECDDGNVVSGDGCSSSCASEFCGDGIVQAALGEECDDGNNEDCDGCSGSCQDESLLPDSDGDQIIDLCDDCPNDAQNDSDGDGVCGDVDNCPTTPNTSQADTDSDGHGNACDNCPTTPNTDQADTDSDGHGNACDNCPTVSNPSQADSDADGLGNSCDVDRDGDGVPNSIDNCSNVPNPGQTDTEGDGRGDACDPDDDNDGVLDFLDNCRTVSNPLQGDFNGDGVGDACSDSDGDGLDDRLDNCPGTPNPDQSDSDGDGFGDACDCADDPFNDADRDGICADQDNCPQTLNPGQVDSDGDGSGDLCDNCPADDNEDQLDSDLDGEGDACDPDDDDDGVIDTLDNCPRDANPRQKDLDGDGFGDACDRCPDDAANDSDGDGVCGDVDNCPVDTNPNQADADGDQVGDVCDNCRNKINRAQKDRDGDGFGNACDNCDKIPNDQADSDGNGVGDVCEKSKFTFTSGGGGSALVTGRGSGGSVTTFSMGLICGAEDVTTGNVGIRIPEGVTGIDFGGCTTPDPGDALRKLCTGSSELGSTVNASLSSIQGPGVPGAPADILFVTLEGNIPPDGLLCRAGDPETFLGLLRLTDQPADTSPALTVNGLDFFNLQPLETPTQVVPLQNIQVQTGPADPLATITVRPAIGEDLTNPRRFEILLSSQIEMHRVVFGLSAFAGALTGQVRIEGCNTAATGPNNLRTCSSTPSLPDNVAADDPDTFTIGPPANLPSPVRDDLIYVSLVGATFRGLGVPDSLNIAGDEALLGVLEFDNSVSDPPVPEISFDGVTSLPGVTVEFEASDGTTVTAAQVRTISGFDSQDDGDGDGAGDEIDNCPFIFNPGQENGGGVNTLVPNAFGDLCECGDGNGDGPVFSNDIQALQQALAGLLEDLSVLDRCSVVGGTECDILDIVTLGQVLDQGGTLEPDCSAANP